MVDQPTSAVGVFHWGFRIVGGQVSDQSCGDRNILTEHALEQRHPRFLPRPASREMQGQLAGGVGDPCGNRNHLVSDGAGVRFQQSQVTGQCRCSTGEIECRDSADAPCSVGARMCWRHVCEGGVLQIRVHLLDDCMPAMSLVGGHSVELARVCGGEKRVEPPHVEQSTLSLVHFRSQVQDASDDQPAVNVVGFLLRVGCGEREFRRLRRPRSTAAFLRRRWHGCIRSVSRHRRRWRRSRI